MINVDGFDFFTNLKGEPDLLIINQELLNRQVDYIKKHKLTSISLFDSFSGRIKDLDFLKEINFIKRIQISGYNIDYSGLYFLKQLSSASLSVESKMQYLDFSRFPLLESLSIDWYSKFPSLAENKNLKELRLRKFRPKSKSCSDLLLPESIEIIEFVQSNILNFSRLGATRLKTIEAHYCNQLESMDGIKDHSSTLKILITDYCRKLLGYEELAYCKELEKIIIGDCGDIPNLGWLANLKKLKHFSFYGTKLTDGDLTLCKGIDYVAFKNSRSYKYKMEDFTQL